MTKTWSVYKYLLWVWLLLTTLETAFDLLVVCIVFDVDSHPLEVVADTDGFNVILEDSLMVSVVALHLALDFIVCEEAFELGNKLCFELKTGYNDSDEAIVKEGKIDDSTK